MAKTKQVPGQPDLTGPVTPKPPKGWEDYSDRAVLATQVSLMVSAYQASMSARFDQWQFCQDVYDDNEILSSLSFADNLDPYQLALMSPRVDGLMGSICDPIVATTPHFVFEHYTMDELLKDKAEKTLQYALSRAMFERKLRDTTLMSILRGRGVVRLRYETMRNDALWDRSDIASAGNDSASEWETIEPSVTYSGLVLDTFPPERSVFYPAYEEQISKLTAVGHWIPTRWEDLLEKQAAGLYYSDTPISPTSDQTNVTPAPVESRTEDFPTRLYELIVKAKAPGDDKERLWLVSYVNTTLQILRIQPYTLPTPWYFAPCPRYEVGQFWPRRSIAERALEAQTIYNDAASSVVFGMAAGTQPQVIITGFSGDQSELRGGIGTIIALKNPITSVHALPVKVDMSMAEALMEKAEEAIDAIMHYSPAQLGQNFQSGTTATAANLVAQGAAAGVTDYIGASSIEWERLASLANYLLADNWLDFKNYHGSAAPLDDPEALKARFVVELAGKAPSKGPDAIRNNLQMFIASMVQLGIMPDSQGLSIDMRELIMVANDLFGFPSGMLDKVITDATKQAQTQGINPQDATGASQTISPSLASFLSGTPGGQAGIPPQSPGNGIGGLQEAMPGLQLQGSMGGAFPGTGSGPGF